MRIPRALYDEIVAHAREDAPVECCGMIASRDGQAVEVHRTRNTTRSPYRYEMDGQEQHDVQMAIEDAGYDLGAIYHSHTRSDPEPSQTDINLAFMQTSNGEKLPCFPGTLYVIVGVRDEQPDVRAWRIDGDGVEQVPLEVV